MANSCCRGCFCIIRWLPVVFVTAIVVWSYYAYVIQMCLFTIDSIPQKVFYILLFHVFLVLFVWSYWQTIFTEPGQVPRQFYLSLNDLESFERAVRMDEKTAVLNQAVENLPVQQRTIEKAARYCEKCKCLKPDRTHHCSVCGRCILKMDHHCPWVNNCVNFTNYKFFVMFLGYALLYCLYVAATSCQFFLRFWKHIGSGSDLSNLHIVFLFFAACMFALSLVSLFGYHIYLTCKNRSTLEAFRAPVFRDGVDKNGFHLGSYANFIEVFGDNKLYWFLPMFSSRGDGATFKTRVCHMVNYDSMGQSNSAIVTVDSDRPSVGFSSTSVVNQNTITDSGISNSTGSFGDGVNFPTRHVEDDEQGLLYSKDDTNEERVQRH